MNIQRALTKQPTQQQVIKDQKKDPAQFGLEIPTLLLIAGFLVACVLIFLLIHFLVILYRKRNENEQIIDKSKGIKSKDDN